MNSYVPQIPSMVVLRAEHNVPDLRGSFLTQGPRHTTELCPYPYTQAHLLTRCCSRSSHWFSTPNVAVLSRTLNLAPILVSMPSRGYFYIIDVVTTFK